MQGFNMGRYHPPHLLDAALSSTPSSARQTKSKHLQTPPTIRFELPFAIWCTTCHPETIIAQGVRFNAQKTKMGMYHSTPIWGFRFKHTVCGGWIEVRTDPERTEYVVISGGRRRDYGSHDGEDEVGSERQGGFGDVGIGDVESVLGKLERKREGETAVERAKVRVEELQARSDRDWADPYEVNKRVRREFRVGRRQRQDDERSGERLKEKFGLGVDVLPVTEEDGVRARLVEFGANGGIDGDAVGSNGAVSRGLFQMPQKKDKPGAGKIGRNGTVKAGKKVDLVAEKKSALRNGLQSNSRARLDPFWEDRQWEKPTKRRRDERVVVDTKRDDGDEEETKEGSVVTRAGGENEAKHDVNVITKVTLVAYDSD